MGRARLALPAADCAAVTLDRRSLLARYDTQLRQDARAEPPARIDHDGLDGLDGGVVRWLDDAGGWEAVLWTDLREGTADAAIARQIAFFARRGRAFEWKHHAHDQPANLPQRLVRAGLRPEPSEAVMVASSADVPEVRLPEGLSLVGVNNPAGVDLVIAVHDEVFGADHSWLRSELLSQLAAGTAAAVLAMAGDRPVGSARMQFHPGTDFASLWGGATLPAWRGRGLYRAMVTHRARLAAARGHSYVQVDALPTSQPILQRLGFTELTTTTPYVWTPQRPEH